MNVLDIQAREILDSRGFPTLEVDLYLADGGSGRASVPSGKSTGSREAVEWRDKDSERYFGRGIQGAIRHIEEMILPSVRNKPFEDQAAFDQHLIQLDGSSDKHRLGANAILGCSIAFARAAADAKHVTLVESLSSAFGAASLRFPIPMMNVINGGKHADSGISTQEFMLVPHGCSDVSEAIRMGAQTYQTLRDILELKGYRVAVGDEGGFAPQLRSTVEALELLTMAIERAGFVPGTHVSLAVDFAANDFYHNGRYEFEGNSWTSSEMTEYCLEIVRRFPIVSIEDGLAEDDWEGWGAHTSRLTGSGVQCVGDDIFVTNSEIFRKGIDQGIANAILIKPNQIGTVTETFDTMHLAAQAHYGTIVSHRSGETDDSFIADFALATASGQMKAGSPARGERVAKYNQLLRLLEKFPHVPLASDIYRR
ncbi:phosphopyruvate hydratase [Alicyclobacillus suci]|uniref:phosphopyruvate hydratase n=1 Tax=Alicyclobacillus suci TaxID=2816080 RepID=UPI001F2770AF|nr:phosphopyruvate hydratase [Alicyclobacillus suci]